MSEDVGRERTEANEYLRRGIELILVEAGIAHLQPHSLSYS